MAAAAGIGRLTVKNSGLFLCDMQEKFRKTISYYPQILAVSSRMLKAAKIMEMPVVVTEQYPKGYNLFRGGHLKMLCSCQSLINIPQESDVLLVKIADYQPK